MSPLSWVQKFKLRGVYRPLGCGERGNEARPRHPPPARAKPSGQRDEAVVRDTISRYYRTLETRNLEAFQQLWAADAVQWRLGRSHGREQIFKQRSRDVKGLLSADTEPSVTSLAILGDLALTEVSADLTLRYSSFTDIQRNVKESFVLRRSGSRWLIVHNETYRGD